MKKKKTAAVAPLPPPPTRYEVEGFGVPSIRSLYMSDAPSDFNGDVRVERWRVVAEKIDEPVEVVHERIRKLWREGTNHHRWQPLTSAAARFGLVLDHKEWGADAAKVKP